ncbi:hypothetical protein T08_14888 [Trichinella sp. T8]|nr:hypothetical protein T08_14888 [Trichinella sp. T8]
MEKKRSKMGLLVEQRSTVLLKTDELLTTDFHTGDNTTKNTSVNLEAPVGV